VKFRQKIEEEMKPREESWGRKWYWEEVWIEGGAEE